MHILFSQASDSLRVEILKDCILYKLDWMEYRPDESIDYRENTMLANRSLFIKKRMVNKELFVQTIEEMLYIVSILICEISIVRR